MIFDINDRLQKIHEQIHQYPNTLIAANIARQYFDINETTIIPQLIYTICVPYYITLPEHITNTISLLITGNFGSKQMLDYNRQSLKYTLQNDTFLHQYTSDNNFQLYNKALVESAGIIKDIESFFVPLAREQSIAGANTEFLKRQMFSFIGAGHNVESLIYSDYIPRKVLYSSIMQVKGMIHEITEKLIMRSGLIVGNKDFVNQIMFITHEISHRNDIELVRLSDNDHIISFIQSAYKYFDYNIIARMKSTFLSQYMKMQHFMTSHLMKQIQSMQFIKGTIGLIEQPGLLKKRDYANMTIQTLESTSMLDILDQPVNNKFFKPIIAIDSLYGKDKALISRCSQKIIQPEYDRSHMIHIIKGLFMQELLTLPNEYLLFDINSVLRVMCSRAGAYENPQDVRYSVYRVIQYIKEVKGAIDLKHLASRC